ncbi:hypothetical protein GCM10010174_56030 [Kutzneria viridogrisea]|uniref:Serine aminopeptidase S33 domain-containing protein n=2 Tax=Kutzneria TaxID=43356 RepID=W5W2S7_9PSEU|nr:alpha/beta fold hydrolase [Kutzneria albida]AHH95132.1 hypothetical protein KALB_1761 [Kutzneria albida DSM 43870]MBA8927510.1 pimeloyl-ACP methyl ester carboxylesterase [Kutzneria viridogrisea]
MLATQDVHSVAELAAGDGTPLALHSWTAADPADVRGVLFYVHGIQSHAGWLFETGPELARRGVATYALDRRGSGLSGGGRGDLPTAEVVVQDYLRGLAAARELAQGLPLTVLGQSFGASVVAALAAGTDPGADAIVYCTPALGQQRARHKPDDLVRLRQSLGGQRSPIALEDEDYTSESRYLEFMANDRLMLRQVTERTRAAMVGLEDLYTGRRAPGGAQVHFVRTELDPIIDLTVAEKVLIDLHETFTATTFPIRQHYVEFSSVRRDYWDWLAEVVLRTDRARRVRTP